MYACRADAAVDRPIRWLVGFIVVTAAPGDTVTGTIPVSARAFADWTENGWHHEAGDF